MPGNKKFGDDEEEPHRDHCPKCGVKLTQGERIPSAAATDTRSHR